jgi:rare lipoprotein A
MSTRHIAFAAALLLAAVPAMQAQTYLCDDPVVPDAVGAVFPNPPQAPEPEPAPPDPLHLRVLRYTQLALKHRLTGLASYYSTSLDGTLTANGETFRNRRFTAAHLTLPLGTWVEIKARATGKTIRLRINDRGPYVKKFAIDLSQAAARALGVDVAEDRHVDIRVIALPGEDPLPEGSPLYPEQREGSLVTSAVALR